jgi:predicted NBD/HSP70 family sugar kinase
MKPFCFDQKPRRKLSLDPNFTPMILGNIEFEKAVESTANPTKVFIALERSNKQIARFDCQIFSKEYNQEQANFIYVERLIKTLLWLKGGFRIYISGDDTLCKQIKEAYSKTGLRGFDKDFMEQVYEHQFEVLVVDKEDIPEANEISKPIGRHLDGYRIGFDAGGSDRKVSAVVDGTAIYSEEVVWFPKINSDPDYHYQGIMDSMKTAAAKLPRVDAIGVSSAGIFIDNRVAVASLFRQVPQDRFDKEVRDMYFRIQKEFNNVPIEVVNDGDVTALAGSMSLNSNRVLGIAMGTSEAAGYVDKLGNITGWLNELSFVPVDYNQESPVDEWSNDYGVGVHYFSQDAVIKLAKAAGIHLEESKSPAEKLKVVQKLAEGNDEKALEIFSTIGVYLGYELAYYARFYDIEHVLILGRVTSGIGGVNILNETNKILEEEFPQLFKKIKVSLPDEMSRRVGQSIAAASLPEIRK